MDESEYDNIQVEFNELLRILSSIVGSYNVYQLVSWYKFASTMGKVKPYEYMEKEECIRSYCIDRNIDMILKISHNTFHHIWSRDDFSIKFCFDPISDGNVTQRDYELALDYFEKKYQEHKNNKTDPIIEMMDIKIIPLV